MAGRIAGITIEIDGNTSKLQTALKGVDKNLKTTQAALRDVDRLLKFNPGNADLLRQKQQLLASSINDTKTRLQTLRDAMDQLRNSDGFDENSADAQNLQREIIATEDRLKDLQRQAKESASVLGSQMQVAGEKIKTVGENVARVGEALTKRVTAPLAAIGAASVKSFNDVDEGMDTIVTKTGATGKALEDMQKSMERIATRIPTDFKTAGSAIGEVNTRFDLTGDALEDLSEKFVKFAQLNDVDVSSAIDSTQSAMKAFGISSKDAGKFLDTLNAVGQKTGASVDRLAQEMTTNAAALKEMGFNASDAANFLGQLSKNGIDSSTVMSGLKRAFASATKDGKSMDQALAELQDTMANAGSDTEAYAIALELFGNRAGPALAEAIRDGRLSLDQLGTALEDNLGNVEQTFESTLDPIDKFKTTLNSAKLVGAEIGNTLMEVVQPALERTAQKAKDLKSRWDGLTKSQQKLIVKIALIVAAIGPALTVLGKLTSGVGSAVTIGGKLITTFSGMASGAGAAGAGIASISAPVVLVIAGVAALIATIATLWRTNKQFRNDVIALWNEIKTKLSTTFKTLQKLFASFTKLVSTIWEYWGDDIMNVVKTTFNTISTIIGDVMRVIQSIIDIATAVINGDWKSAWEGIKNLLANVWQLMKDIVNGAVENIKAKISLGWSVVKQIFGGTWESIKTTFAQTWANLKDRAATSVENIKTRVSNGWASIRGTTSSIWSSIASSTSSAWERIRGAITRPLDSARAAVRDLISRIRGYFNFSWSLPRLRLPHLKITGRFNLNPPSVPRFSVSWYKKAYDNPVLFTRPTVLPTMGGLKGFGDGHGAEVVLSYNKLKELSGGRSVINNITVNPAPGMDEQALADMVASRIEFAVNQKQAVFG